MGPLEPKKQRARDEPKEPKVHDASKVGARFLRSSIFQKVHSFRTNKYSLTAKAIEAAHGQTHNRSLVFFRLVGFVQVPWNIDALMKSDQHSVLRRFRHEDSGKILIHRCAPLKRPVDSQASDNPLLSSSQERSRLRPLPIYIAVLVPINSHAAI